MDVKHLSEDVDAVVTVVVIADAQDHQVFVETTAVFGSFFYYSSAAVWEIADVDAIMDVTTAVSGLFFYYSSVAAWVVADLVVDATADANHYPVGKHMLLHFFA